MENASISPTIKPRLWNSLRIVVLICSALIVFLFALDLVVAAMQNLGADFIHKIDQLAANPFIALFAGLLITAIIQSSSATTSLCVGLVGAGSLSLQNAVPIIIGANIGTTITSMIVSLGFLNKKKELKRAVACGSFHCFFNLLTALLLFPLEHYFHLLSNSAESIAKQLVYEELPASVGSSLVEPTFGQLTSWVLSLFSPVFAVGIAFVLLVGSILFFRKFVSDLLTSISPRDFSQTFFRRRAKSFLWGLITTAIIRSSTITTSVVVPFVAKKIVSLKNAASFILGANVGTTVTAFLAAILYTSNSNAVSIAIAHFLFNFIGVLVFFPVPALRDLPIRLSETLGKATMIYRPAGFIFLLLTFFFIPFILIYLSGMR